MMHGQRNIKHVLVFYRLYRTVVLAAVFYRCQNVTLREVHRMRMCEDMVVRKLFGTKTDEVTGDWRRLNSEDLMICAPHQMFSRSNREE